MEIVLGRTDNALCPVTALLAYLALSGNGPGFLFLFTDGHPLTKQRFMSKVREVLASVGVDPSQATHFVSGQLLATANARGLNDSTIQMLGRWQSSAYKLYIRTPREELASSSTIQCSY